MQKQYRKIKQYLRILEKQRYGEERGVGEICFCPCEYKTSNTPPPLENFLPFENGSMWGDGFESHAWFHFSFDIPEDMTGEPTELSVKSERTGWDADNPQFIAYVNGKLRQGLDTNHTSLLLNPEEGRQDVYIYGYTGPRIKSTRFFAGIRQVNKSTEQLYYDIKVPFDMLDYLRQDSKEYAEIIRRLDEAVSLLDLYEIGSEDFFLSVCEAQKYMTEEFYLKYCSVHTRENVPYTVGIGHTHIDCAWKWTLKQTREKVQRSFGTVLELMKRYPEYKFMSSQPFLYKNLKEEAPELYSELKERVSEGRWEVEGAMWVEPDCNLSSGESLVRQVLYGKRFFKKEFGVDSRVLWLPDVFGYSAALPQILKKSGVDWFVTSKISWNDTNTMPYDIFKWVGIDGTPINAYFLTAQNRGKGDAGRGTTYVGNTGAGMISGTWHRMKQKALTSEALLTFGYGDGGGGPTAEMLEMGRRSSYGIPGAPSFRQEFAGDFLKHLEKRIENNPLLPKWQGELYLEFHRGTYTSISKNKRNNRRSEFLYLDAELLAMTAKKLIGSAFPKEALSEGWEMILTNQFHDIVPGSSIHEVYEQSDIDYAYLMGNAERIIEESKELIASRLDREKGYAVFNPHSFSSGGLVKISGRSAIVGKIPPKGYRLTNEFTKENSVKIHDNTVETNIFRVTFDESMQISSIYDKVNDREIIECGKVGNEIRLYADHPDKYDAWEWQEYSLDKYMPLTSLESVELIDDGARFGIKIIRPYKQSRITQTVWFTDNIPAIDFETVADWHQHHIMAKAVFPTNINSDKATYEIQFGRVERPTHKNTSWDRAKFEVCAQKYADLSEGGYGVSILNDCKYGHDIHDGEIALSLFKSPTYPDEEADQGEITFTYSVCPHKGRLDESDTTRLSYYLNYPMTAVKATGDASSLPEELSPVSLDRENVIIETFKESEDGEDTIIRLYESENRRTRVTLTTAFPAKQAFLCDLMENELCELEITDGRITLDVGCFEIITVKLK